MNLTGSATPGSIFYLGTTTISYRASDLYGNVAWCSFNITVVDAQPPVVVCPSNIRVSTDPGVAYATVNYPVAFASDNSKLPVSVVSSPPSGSRFPLGSTWIEVTATDKAGFSSSCEFEIDVIDTEAPTITCPAPVTAYKTLGLEYTTGPASWVVPAASDNAGQVGLTVDGSAVPGQLFSLGTTTVTYTATDASGNQASCSFNVTIIGRFCERKKESSSVRMYFYIV